MPAQTLWSEFLGRLLLGATLAAPVLPGTSSPRDADEHPAVPEPDPRKR